MNKKIHEIIENRESLTKVSKKLPDIWKILLIHRKLCKNLKKKVGKNYKSLS